MQILRVRAKLRAKFFGAMNHIASIDDTRDIFYELMREQNAIPAAAELGMMTSLGSPYDALSEPKGETALRPGSAVFLTGRFRSGSTLLWNIFRHVPDVTSYYEPFNERRWFDTKIRGANTDQTHIGVSDYWSEYNDLEELGQHFQTTWKFRQLYMPATAWNLPMQRYVETIIARTRGRAVLQFNEVDFRLGWLRARFPRVPIIHIFRHPRDQWCSTLGNSARTAAKCQLREFDTFDGFYLLSWARDLRHTFPFLTLEKDAYAYELYYQIWRLSYLFGKIHADLSVAFEDLVADPRTSIRAVLNAAKMANVDESPLVPLVSAGRTGKWRECADSEWFSQIEANVEKTIGAYVGPLAIPG